MLLLLLGQIVALGNSATATKFATVRKINGTNFDGSGDITTAKWGTARTIALSGAVSGSANVDGSGNVTINTVQGNIAVLTGTITMPEAGAETITGTKDISYPSGYTKDNCVVLSVMSHGTVRTDYWSTPMTSDSSPSMLLGNGDVVVSLKPNLITVRSDKVATEQSRQDITYKIVLMKVS